MRPLKLLICCLALLLSTACSQQGDTDKQARREKLITSNDELLNKGNVDYADQIFSDDYRGRGPEAIKEMVANLRNAFPDLQVEIGPIVIEGDLMGWRRTHTGTHRGEIMGFTPTGKKISWESIIISRREDGNTVEEWGQSNLMEVLQNESKAEHNAEEVIASVRSAMDALNDKDAKAYVQKSSPENTRFLPTSPNLFRGAPTVEAMEKDFRNGMEFDMQLVDPEVAFFGNTAVVTGYQTGTNHFPDGQVISGKRKYSSVLIWEDDEWNSVHFHISKVE